MIPYLRREKILTLLSDKDLVTLNEIQEYISNISISTLRRDLKYLEEEGKVVLLTGGAVKLCSADSDLPVSAKQSMHKKDKEIIALLASEIIKDGDIIYLDSGTTCTALMEHIYSRKITIITSNTAILQYVDILVAEVIFLGGKLNDSLSSVSGPLTDNNISIFNFDKAFIGANGVDINRGVTTPSITEANKKQRVIKQSNEVFLLCDSSKFNKVLMTKSFDIEQCIIISDKYDNEIGSRTKMIVPEK